jgi:hypothetical protein|tara:strand:+ start:289 stop:459 length:171 start_codon:yes stop_codon:yes gene_type:complete
LIEKNTVHTVCLFKRSVVVVVVVVERRLLKQHFCRLFLFSFVVFDLNKEEEEEEED